MANYENKIRELVRILDYIDRRSIDYEKEPEAFKWLSLGLSDYKEYFELVKELKQTPAFKINYGVKDPDTFLREVSGNQIIDIINFYKTLSNSPEEVYREVPIKIIGESIPVKEGRAEINFYYKEVTLKGLLSDIPNSVNLNISALTKIGDELTVSDIVVPAKVTIVTNSDTVLVDLQKLGEKETEIPTPPEEEEEKREEKKESGIEIEEEKKPKKEDSTVPTELESLVAQYKQFQADELEAGTTPHTTAEAIKRARATWETRRRVELIRENRLALIQDKTEREKQREIEELDQDLFLIKTVKANAKSVQVLTQNIEQLSRQAVIAQAANLGIGLTNTQINRAVQDLTYAGLSGAINFNNFHDLDVITQLTFIEQGIAINSPINELYTTIQARDHELEVNAYTDNPDQLEEEINKADTESQKYFSTSSKNLVERVNLQSGKPGDFEETLQKASYEQQKVLTSLLEVAPNAVLPSAGPTPLSQHATALEAALRQIDPQLRINPNEVGSQVIGILEKTKGENRNISSGAVRLLSIGLTPERFARAEEFAKNPANSETDLGKLYGAHKDVFQQVRHQLGKISKSKIGQEIRDNTKPLTGISAGLTNFYNSNKSPAIQAVTKVILNPIGSARAWTSKLAGKQIGQYLIANSNNLIAKKFGSYLLEHGLKKGITEFTSAAAKKLALKAVTWAALKLGITITLSAVPIAGPLLNIIVQAAIWVAEKVISAAYNAFQSAAESVYGEKIKGRDILALLAAPVAVAATAGAAIFGGLVFLTRTAQVAVVSATGIIIGSVVTIGLYTGFAYLVAPILSTLVQFDAVEKVNYPAYDEISPSSGDCAWPTKGHYVIITGPRGGTHHLSQLEAIDIGAPDGSPLLSATSGTVTFTGVYSNYGNTVKIESQTSAGKTLVIYGHLSETSVGEGQKVNQGQQIGLVGGSGGWSPHIHMEYQGIKYNQCPAGGLKIKEECCIPYDGGICSGTCDAFSN